MVRATSGFSPSGPWAREAREILRLAFADQVHHHEGESLAPVSSACRTRELGGEGVECGVRIRGEAALRQQRLAG